jgi:hypothetical protein
MPTSLLTALLAAGSLGEAEASSFRRITFDELVTSSLSVVQVRVVETESFWYSGAQAYISTNAELEVVRSLDGGFQPGDRLTVREAGGAIDDFVVQAIGFPQFVQGDELVIFLSAWEDGSGDWRVNHYGQGFWRVTKDQNGAEVLVPGPVQGLRPDQSETHPEPVIEPLTPVRALAERVASYWR